MNAEILLFGTALTALALLFAVKVLGYSLESERRFWRNFPLFLRYTLVLIREIFKSSLAVAKLAWSPEGKPDPVIVEFHSGLPTDFQNALLANSITLTPGTYTLIQEGDRFVVHCLRREYADGIEVSTFVKIGAMVIRSIIGPRSTDRIMSVNMLGTMTICSIAVLSVLLDEGYLADVAMIYAMISFVAVLMMASMFVPSKPKAPVLDRDKDMETAAEGESGGEQK